MTSTVSARNERLETELKKYFLLIFLAAALIGCATTKPDPATMSLTEAAALGKTDRVSLLLKQGTAVDEKTSAQQPPLMMAALAGQTPTVQILLDNGAALESRDKFGRTPLMCALLGGNPETVQTLLERGADINAKDYSVATPYFIASQDRFFFKNPAGAGKELWH
jgi:ankyrin repeat protein